MGDRRTGTGVLCNTGTSHPGRYQSCSETQRRAIRAVKDGYRDLKKARTLGEAEAIVREIYEAKAIINEEELKWLKESK